MATTDYMKNALEVLNKFGIGPKPEDTRLMDLLEEVKDVDEAKVVAIASIAKYMGAFNQLVRDNVDQMNFATRYETINGLFNSIRDDSKEMVDQLADGKIDLGERVHNFWEKMTKGTLHQRFDKIATLYNAVSGDVKVQLDKESNILEAYQDFRLALKQSGIMAAELLEMETKRYEASKETLATAQATLEAYTGTVPSEKAKLEMTRDEALRAQGIEDKKYQLIKDVSENLDIGYKVGETMMAKLAQTHGLKEQVYRKAITFFTTNEHVFTTMDAVYAAQLGLHEQTETLDAMKDGINKGLEQIAELSGKVEEAALKAGYGATLNASSVQKLVDSIVEYQENSTKMIAQLRAEATTSKNDIDRIVDDGSKRCIAAITSYTAPAAAQ